ncbi:MAG: type II toxin-antitoxin system HicB family antitoxin [Nitrospirae bacterium]|nr:type II toxin-antitoxin system HicB family antitoxin [Nitrospirota bacterium]
MINNKTSLIQQQTYTFTVVVEPDEDQWFVYCPALRSEGAATCGRTEEEALKNIREVLEMIVDELIEDGKEVPVEESSTFAGVEVKVPASV